MQCKNRIVISLSALLVATSALAQVFTLDECRQMALQQNKKVQIDEETVAATKDIKRSTVANFFPKISANGAYMWNQKNFNLISDSYGMNIGNFNLGTANVGGTFQFGSQIQNVLNNLPDLIKPYAQQGASAVGGLINSEYTKLYDALSLDIHHVLVGQVGVTQPIFVGGRIVNSYKMAKTAEQIAEIKQQMTNTDLVLKVDEAYWRVVSVQEKVKLATQYHDLMVKMKGDVDNLVEEGVATRSDQLKVMVKLNESEQKLGQATDGLELSRMALCEVIGKDLYFDIQVDSVGLEDIDLNIEQENLNGVADRRQEVQLLEKVAKLAKTSKNLAAAGLMPNVLASANYVMTNKSLENGWNSNKYFGFFNAGVVVNVPIAHADAIYRVKAARHAQKAAQLKLEETRELITLQATQSQQKVSTAHHKLIRAKAAAASATEVLRMAQAGFDEGVISSTELLGAQTQWMSAESDRLDAAIELRMAELEYRKNSGRL